MRLQLPRSLNIDEAVANSYRDFHCKGIDYICLRRSAELTIKLYFFNGDASRLPDVVHPHDHRYPFTTWVVSGCIQNSYYEEHARGDLVTRFKFFSPLLGGSGFEYDKDVKLLETERGTYVAGQTYEMDTDKVHTIRIIESGTVLLLHQFGDVVPPDAPTRTYARRPEPPSLEGLYRRFDADTLIARLRDFTERTGYSFEVAK